MIQEYFSDLLVFLYIVHNGSLEIAMKFMCQRKRHVVQRKRDNIQNMSCFCVESDNIPGGTSHIRVDNMYLRRISGLRLNLSSLSV